MGVPVLDPGPDVCFQLLDGVVVAALQEVFGQGLGKVVFMR